MYAITKGSFFGLSLTLSGRADAGGWWVIRREESAAGYRKPGAAASGNLRLAQAACIWCKVRGAALAGILRLAQAACLWCKVRGGGHSPGYLSPRECNQIGYAVILVIDRERESRHGGRLLLAGLMLVDGW